MGNRKYTTEFKLDAVRLALSSETSQAQVARDLEIKEPSLYNWNGTEQIKITINTTAFKTG